MQRHRCTAEIAAVDRRAAAEPTTSATPSALPGLPNLHSHAFQRGMAGLAEVRGRPRRQLLDLARGHVPLRRPA